jgi:hypothetical protein
MRPAGRYFSGENMRTYPLQFVVASTPRSGTKYLSQILRALDVKCYHEELLDTYQQIYYTEEKCGVASWLSVPFLNNLPKGTVLLHQVRDPINTINSLIYTHNYWRGNGPNMPFIREHFQPRTQQPEIEFWSEWHRRIDAFGAFRYRVEDIPIAEILSMIGIERSEEQINEVLSRFPRNVNTYGPVPRFINWLDIPDSVCRLIEEYGYSPA